MLGSCLSCWTIWGIQLVLVGGMHFLGLSATTAVNPMGVSCLRVSSYCSVTKFYLTHWDPMDQSKPGFLSFTISSSLLKLMSIELVIPSNHLILCHPLLLLPSIFPSIRVFSIESTLLIRWSKYWSFSFSIRPNESSGLISLRMD